MFGKKKDKKADDIKDMSVEEAADKDSSSEDIAYTKTLRDKLDNRYTGLVYWCQAIALIFCALSIPQSVLNRETVLTALLSVAAVSMIFPMFYVSVVNEYNKKSKKQKNNGESPDNEEKET